MPDRKLTLRPFVLLAAASGVGCEPTQSTAEPSTTPYALEILSTETCSLPSAAGETARGVLGIKVRLTSRTDLGVAANYFYASILTSDGSRYLAELPGCQPVLAAPPLRAGQSAEGFLNIPVPQQKKAETLAYLPPIGALSERERATERKLTSRAAP